MAGSVDEEALHQLYLWVDNIPLSRPKRNLSRDFSDGVLVAEVIKFYFPKMVEMHNYVPANSLQQKLSNWGHLNRAAPLPSPPRPSLHTPETQSAIPVPISQEGAEQTELLGTGGCDAQDRAMRAGRGGVSAHSAEAAPGGAAEAQEAAHQLLTGAGSPGWHWLRGCGFVPEGPRGRCPRPPGRGAAQIAEKEQELLASQETVQVLQMKVRRLEHLLQLKNVRIDDLSRRLQQAERKQR
ncbi:sperm flagellar protein 1 isoform X1 [Mirounga angustirostris]|uniref:sperm flagellar protein 1 isoform X1 n=1 Tax=Mirounga angustirostris TaxID=9716 RepID=UPI00313EE20F